VSDLSYKHVGKPDEVVKPGQPVKVKVLKVDRERGRISLGLKQVEPDPWEGIENRVKPGDELSGRVIRTADFGAFIEVEPGVEGLLPASELTWKRGVRTADVVKEGDVLRLKVLQLDPAKRRISLSLKQSQGDPWVGAERKFEKHALVDATVLSLTDFGAFVELEPGVEGLVHISELSDRRVNAVGDVLKPGQREQFRVLDVDEDNRRIRLSLKAVKEQPREPAPEARPQAARQGPTPARPAPAKAAPRKRDKNLRGGMDVGGIGLGDLRL
jgi:small subunit ribosomal protein S1